MEIILKEDIIGLGYKNDIVNVKNGYGRNYLIPTGKGIIASPSAKKQLAENEIITQQDPQMQMFAQLMEGILKKLERYCSTARPMLGGEVYLTGEEVCKQLRLSPRTLQDYRDNGTIAYCKIGGKILYRQSDIQAMLERHYNPISKKPWQV